MKVGQIKRSLLLFCLATSALLHVGAIWLLYRNPFQFENQSLSAMMKASPKPQIIPKDQTDLIVEKIQQALDQSLNSTIAASELPSISSDLVGEEKSQAMEPLSPGTCDKKSLVTDPLPQKKEPLAPAAETEEFSSSMPHPFDPEFEASMSDFALDSDFDEEPFGYESENYCSIEHSAPPPSAQAIEDDYTLTDEQFSPSALPTHQQDGLAPQFVSSLQKLKAQKKQLPAEEVCEESMFSALEESTAPKLILPNSVDYLRSQWIKRSLADRTLPDLDHYGLNDVATSVVWEEDFQVDVTVMPVKGASKYAFSVTIHPDFQVDTANMRQNFYFVIDRTSSIEKHKFSRFKRAVQRSLAALRDGDNFNIYIFDKKVTKLSDKTLAVTPKTLQMAEDFLEEQNTKGHFTQAGLYNSLEDLLPQTYHPEELHSVILITDGRTSLGNSKNTKSIASWSEKHAGAVNFYAATAGKGNNLVLLDLLSYSTAGKMLYSDTNAAFPRKLVRLVKNLHNPILKSMTIDALPRDPKAKITLYPQNPKLPPMFADQPYTIIGTIDELCDITLYIQGKNRGQTLNIRKDISFKEGARNSRQLEKMWATTQSHTCYDHFLKFGRKSHLEEAVQIVAPYRGTIAFEQ